MIVPQTIAVGPLANAALTHPDALECLLEEPDFHPDEMDVSSFWEVLPRLDEKLARTGFEAGLLKRHLTARTPESLSAVARTLSEVSQDVHRLAANAVMFSGGIFFDLHLPSDESFQALCTRYAKEPIVDTQRLLEIALTFVFKRIQHEWRNNSILAEKRHLLLSLYPVFFHGDDEVSHPNPARLREEIALYMVRALEAGAVQEIGEEELFFDPEFLQTISLSPDIYIGVGAEKLAPQDFVALTADLAGHFSGLGFHCMAAYFCQATWDAVVPSFEPCDPDLQTLFLRLAQSYHALGYYRQALDYFEKGLRIETEGRNRDAQAYRWLLECVASLHMVLGYYEQAKEILDLLSAETGSFQDIGEKTRLLIDFANEALG